MQELYPIVALLALIALVVARLPRVELGHSRPYLRRRFFNWFPVGLSYAFLYMGRYNLTVCKNALGPQVMSKEDFGVIFSVGTVVYGLSFLINGPLADKWGGRKTILIATVGAASANLAMGLLFLSGRRHDLVGVLGPLYALNMYFQSFGAVAIVKVNSAWFHVRERGTFGGMFGILISLGIYFAFDWGQFIVDHAPLPWLFFVPAIALVTFAAIDFALVRDTPGRRARRLRHGGRLVGRRRASAVRLEVGKRMLKNPVILTIACVEFCSGFAQRDHALVPDLAKEIGSRRPRSCRATGE